MFTGYEIKQHIATLSQNGSVTKELNLISYNGAPAKFDLRSWMHTGEEAQLLKGLTMSKEEIFALRDALNSL